MAYGVTAQGFQKKRLDQIQTEIETDLRAKLGNSISTVPKSVFGNIIGVLADREADVWEKMEAVYDSRDPQSATGVSLDQVVALNNIKRRAATSSRQLNLHLFGVAGTLIPGGTQVSVLGNASAKFTTDADVTLVAGQDEIQKITFGGIPASGSWALSFGDQSTVALPFNADATAVQTALRALIRLDEVVVTGDYATGFTVTFQGVDGKQDQPLLIANGTNLVTAGAATVLISVLQTTIGQPQGLANATAIDTGSVQAPAYSLTVIDNPVSGLSRVLNREDATVGLELETDSELRTRRKGQLQIGGAGTLDAIKSRLLALTNVTDVVPFENDDKVTDVRGLPPNSYEMVVNGGDPSEITNTIWKSKGLGIKSWGNQVFSMTDANGVEHDIRWSRPTTKPIYLSVDIYRTPDFPVNGDIVVENTLVNFGNALGIGKPVIVYPQLVAALTSIPGITDVTVRIGTSAVSNVAGAPAQDDNIAILANEVSDWDTGRTSVNLL